jgi:hypothetical protein
VEVSREEKNGADSSEAPRIGVKLMIAILIGVALVAVYANVQKGRHERIEQVIIVPAATATPGAAPSAPTE